MIALKLHRAIQNTEIDMRRLEGILDSSISYLPQFKGQKEREVEIYLQILLQQLGNLSRDVLNVQDTIRELRKFNYK